MLYQWPAYSCLVGSLPFDGVPYSILQRIQALLHAQETIVPVVIERPPLGPDALERRRAGHGIALGPTIRFEFLQLVEAGDGDIPFGARLPLVLGDDLPGGGGEVVDDEDTVARVFEILQRRRHESPGVSHRRETDLVVARAENHGPFTLDVEGPGRLLVHRGGAKVQAEVGVGVRSRHDEGVLEVLQLAKLRAHFQLLLVRLLAGRGRAVFNVGAIFRREEALDVRVLVGHLGELDLGSKYSPADGGNDSVEPLQCPCEIVCRVEVARDDLGASRLELVDRVSLGFDA